MRRKKPKTFRYDFDTAGYFEGTGETMADAKADAGRKAHEALLGAYNPLVYRFALDGVAPLYGIIFREPSLGWSYRLFNDAHICGPKGDAEPFGPYRIFGLSGGYDDLAECERAMRRHAAQMLFRHEGPDGSEVIENEHDRREHLDWCRWQRGYRAARERGLSDEDARRIA